MVCRASHPLGCQCYHPHTRWMYPGHTKPTTSAALAGDGSSSGSGPVGFLVSSNRVIFYECTFSYSYPLKDTINPANPEKIYEKSILQRCVAIRPYLAVLFFHGPLWPQTLRLFSTFLYRHWIDLSFFFLSLYLLIYMVSVSLYFYFFIFSLYYCILVHS